MHAYVTPDEFDLLVSAYHELQKLKNTPALDRNMTMLYQALSEGEERVAQDKLDDLLCIIHRDGGHYINQYGPTKALDDAVKVLFKWREAFDKQEDTPPGLKVDNDCEFLRAQANAWHTVYGLCRQLGMDRLSGYEAYTGEQLVCEFIRHLANQRLKEKNCEDCAKPGKGYECAPCENHNEYVPPPAPPLRKVKTCK